MISKQDTVKAILESTGTTVYYFYPASWIKTPVISWRESGNRCLHRVDGKEHLSELTYTVDIWADSPAEIATLAKETDSRMTAARFRRDSAVDLFETSTRYYHKSIRYRCVADESGNIYQ